MPTNDKEYQREYMRQYRARKKLNNKDPSSKGKVVKVKETFHPQERTKKDTIQLDLRFHNHYIFCCELWSKLESKRLVSKQERTKFLEALSYFNYFGRVNITDK